MTTNRELRITYALTCLRELELTNGKRTQKWSDLRDRICSGLQCNAAKADACIQANVECGKMHKLDSNTELLLVDGLYGAETLKYIKNSY